ncbi:MAG: hypothetical protein HYV97_16685 [Bdellovibrio sp.]|nr:hypothetical protein [Bdellovibrio sp.]
MTQLRSVCQQIAEDENIEVIDIENNQEIHQIMANYGSTLMLYSHPKKCALALQLHNKIIKKVQAKTVLLTDKVIPVKTLSKFMKLGLTDCITEPISPKSLLYKIKLLIRSLPNLNEQELEYRTISTNDSTAKNAEKDLATRNKKDGQNPEKAPENTHETVNGQVAAADEKMIGQQKTKDAAIETNYRGDVSEHPPEEKEGDDQPKKHENASAIETYYKGDITESSTPEDGKMVGETSPDNVSDNEIEKLRKGFSIDVEAESATHDAPAEMINKFHFTKTKRSGLAVENNESESHDDGEVQVIDPYLKSKHKHFKTVDVEDDIPQNTQEPTANDNAFQTATKKRTALKVEQTGENYLQQRRSELKAKKLKDNKAEGLEIEDDTGQDEQESTDHDGIPQVMKSKRKSLDVESDGDNYLQQRRNELKARKLKDEASEGLAIEDDITETAEDDQENQSSGKENPEHKKAKQNLLTGKSNKQTSKEKQTAENSEFSARKKKLSHREQEAEQETSQEDIQEDIDEESNTAAQSPTPKTRKGQEERDIALLKRLKKEIEEEAETFNHNNSKKLSIDAEAGPKEKGAQTAKKIAHKEKDRTKLDIENDRAQDSMKKKDQSSEKEQKKLETSGTINNTNEELQGSSQPADYIEKYYNQKKPVRPESKQSWDKFAHRKEAQTAAPPPKPLGDKSLIIEKEELGEQTIDYKKIQDEFAALDGAFTNQVKTRYQISEEAVKPKDQTLFHGGHNPNEVSASTSFATQNTNDEIENTETIYYPNSKGIEYVIRALHLYSEKDTKDLDILAYLGKTIHHQLKGRISFLSKDKKSSLFIELFNGHLQSSSVPGEMEEINPSMSLIGTQIVSAEQWETYKSQKLNTWSQARLPSWSDETFQKDNLTYIYPYYEGTDFIGFSVIDFAGKFDPVNAPLVEILCESARSIYLYNYHLGGKRGQYQGKIGIPESEHQAGMFNRLKGLFGKKAG